MDRAKFFAAAKTRVFNGKLTQAQVDGINALLDACASEGVSDWRHVAYILATPMIETGGSFVPITESLNYKASVLVSKFGARITQAQANSYGRSAAHSANQEAIANIIYGGTWGAKNLGNTQPGDGWKFRGRGLVQTTGRRLYELFGYGDNPDAVCDIKVSASIMARGMRDGTFTGRKLADYIKEGVTDYYGARRVVNGTDKAAEIAVYAKSFEAALGEAGYDVPDAAPAPPVASSEPTVLKPVVDVAAPAPVQTVPSSSFLAAIVDLIAKIFKGAK